MKMKIVLVACILLWCSAHCQGRAVRPFKKTAPVEKQGTTQCNTPAGQPGQCILLSDCPQLTKLRKEKPNIRTAVLIRKSNCGFVQSRPKVCCPSAKQVTTEKPKRPSEPMVPVVPVIVPSVPKVENLPPTSTDETSNLSAPNTITSDTPLQNDSPAPEREQVDEEKPVPRAESEAVSSEPASVAESSDSSTEPNPEIAVSEASTSVPEEPAVSEEPSTAAPVASPVPEPDTEVVVLEVSTEEPSPVAGSTPEPNVQVIPQTSTSEPEEPLFTDVIEIEISKNSGEPESAPQTSTEDASVSEGSSTESNVEVVNPETSTSEPEVPVPTDVIEIEISKGAGESESADQAAVEESSVTESSATESNVEVVIPEVSTSAPEETLTTDVVEIEISKGTDEAILVHVSMADAIPAAPAESPATESADQAVESVPEETTAAQVADETLERVRDKIIDIIAAIQAQSNGSVDEQ